MDAVSGVAVPGWIIEKIRTSKEFKGKSICEGDKVNNFSFVSNEKDNFYFQIATELLEAKKGKEYYDLQYKKAAISHLAAKMKKQGAEQGHMFLALVNKSGETVKCEKGRAVSFPRQLDLGLSEKDIDDAMDKGKGQSPKCNEASYYEVLRAKGKCPKLEGVHHGN